ncbi:peptidase associated/transthyretin-like domain-containing protein [Paracoccus xiamenensis]|uniref:hypothetical protein n=1 Tax=Paracoccus xiamenensis TaxID=2714901 RepID=UPI001F1CFD9B|nr:hypothetical protein [Paracoccus xiamenensis]
MVGCWTRKRDPPRIRWSRSGRQQANAIGYYARPEGGVEVEEGFRGWGRVITDFQTGEWDFHTFKPGKVVARVKLVLDISERVSTPPDPVQNLIE